MAKQTNTESKKYDVIPGKVLFDYKQDRDNLIRAWNSRNFAWDGKPLPHSPREERIPYLDWNQMIAKIDSADEATKKAAKLQMKAYWRRYFEMVHELQEEMIFEMIDTLTGYDKTMEELAR